MFSSIDRVIVKRIYHRWMNTMTAVTVSPKYQIVIPKDVREQMGIKPGQKISVMVYQGRIQLIPLGPIEELRGMLEGVDTDIEREPDRI